MKTILLMTASFALSAAWAAEVPTALPPAATESPSVTNAVQAARPKAKRLTEGEMAAMREKAKAERAAREKAEAEKLGVSVDELKKRRAEERKARRERRDLEMAAKEGISVEEYRQKRQARKDEAMAKRFGVTVEELRKMTPDQRRELQKKLHEQRRAQLQKRN